MRNGLGLVLAVVFGVGVGCREQTPAPEGAATPPAQVSSSRLETPDAPAVCPAPSAPRPSHLVVLAPSAPACGTPVGAAALLTDGAGAPLADREVRFTLGAHAASSRTGADGWARASLPAPAAAGSAQLEASFAGDAELATASASSVLAFTRTATTLRLGGNLLWASDAPATVSARLTGAVGQPLEGQTVHFTAGVRSASAVTDATGEARASLPAQGTTGTVAVRATFEGTQCLQAAQDEGSALRYLPTGFAIWGGNAPGLQLGASVNFWGHSWADQVRGGEYLAQADFKGWAGGSTRFQVCQGDARLGEEPRVQGGCWESKTGNSAPPAELPEYIGVLVTTAVDKRQGAVFGNTAALAVLKVQPVPAYGPVPGKPGWGTLVAVADAGGPPGGPGVLPRPAVLAALQRQPEGVGPGEAFEVTLELENASTTAEARDVTVSERFTGGEPPTAQAAVGTLAGGARRTLAFPRTAPVLAPRGAAEPEPTYLARLAGAGLQRLTSQGVVRFSDPTIGFAPALATDSSSQLHVPVLTFGFASVACATPCSTVRYALSATNIGSGAAASATTRVQLPDGIEQRVEFGAMEPGATVQRTLDWALPALAAQGEGEDAGAYLARLLAASGAGHAASATLDWTDARGNAYGTLSREVRTETVLPVVTVSADAPATVLPGQDYVATFTLTNQGSARAEQARLQVAGAEATAVALAPGETRTLQVPLTAPAVAPRVSGESDADYLARLQAADGARLATAYALTWTSGCASFGPVSGEVAVTRVLPRLTVALTGPAEVESGTAATYQARVQASGGAVAQGLVLVATLPDGSTRAVPLPAASLAPGEVAEASFVLDVPKAHPAGPITVSVELRWQDARGGAYGPLAAAAVTEVLHSNRPPSIVTAPVREASDVAGYRYPVEAVDPDVGDVLAYSLPQAPAGMSVGTASGVIQWDASGWAGNNRLHNAACMTGGGQVASLVPAVDVVVVVDESGSMDSEHRWLADFAAPLEAHLTSNGVGSGATPNRYGLAGYAPVARPINVGSTRMGSYLEFIPATDQLRLSGDGSREDGWLAIRQVLASYPLRETAARNIILVTDEDRDNADPTVTYAGILADLQAHKGVLNAVVNARFRCGDNSAALGLGQGLTGYKADGRGGYVTCPNARAISGDGNTVEAYVNLAIATGGAAWDVDVLRAGGIVAQSFTNALLKTKVQEILQQLPTQDLPDAYIHGVEAGDGVVHVDVGNRGLAALPLGSAVQVRAGQTELAVVALPELAPGALQRVSVPFASAGAEPQRLSAQLFVAPGLVECSTENNTLDAAWVRVRATDREGLFDEQAFSVQVVDVNQAPSITSTPGTTIGVGRRYTYTVSATDPDRGDAVTYALAVAPRGMSVNALSGEVSFLPDAAQQGTHPVEVVARDLAGAEARQHFTLSVDGAILPPRFTSTAPVRAIQGTLYEYAAQASADPSSLLRFDVFLGPTGFNIDAASGVVRWQVPANFDNQSQRVVLRVRDQLGNYDLQVFTLLGDLPNQAPVITSTPGLQATVGTAYAYPPGLSDANILEAHTWQATIAPPGVTVNAGTGALSWPAASVGSSNPAGMAAANPYCVVRDPSVGRFTPHTRWLNGRVRSVSQVLVGPLADSNLDGALTSQDLVAAVGVSASETNLGTRRLHAFDVRTGDILWSYNQRTPEVSVMPALADLEGAGSPSVLLVDSLRHVVALWPNGAQRWVSSVPAAPSSLSGNAISVTDLEGDGKAEVLLGPSVFDAKGALRWQFPTTGSHQGPSLALDLDGDGTREVLYRGEVREAGGALRRKLPSHNNTAVSTAFYAPMPVAGSARPHVIASDVSGGGNRLSRFDADGNLVWRSAADTAAAGPVLVADFTGDGADDLFLAASGRLYSAAGALLWTVSGTPAWSNSQGRAALATDLDRDGELEILTASGTDVYVFAGRTGALLWRFTGGGSVQHVPTLVDVDGTGDALLVMGESGGLRALASATTPWNSEARVVHQRDFALDQVTPALRVNAADGARAPAPMLVLGVRASVAQATRFLPDLRVSAPYGTVNAAGTAVLTAAVNNRGPGPAPGSEVVFRRVDATGATEVGRSTVGPLGPNGSALATLSVPRDALADGELTAEVVPEDVEAECERSNDVATGRVIQLEVTDYGGLKARQTWVVAVTDRAHAPVFTTSVPSARTTVENRAWGYAARATTANTGDVVTYALVTAPDGAGVDPWTGEVRWVPRWGQTGSHTFTLRATSLNGQFANQSWNVSVSASTEPNAPPVFTTTPTPYTVVNVPYRYEARAVDPDGGRVTYALASPPAGMWIDPNVGTLLWTPAAVPPAPVNVRIVATDARGATREQSYVLRVYAEQNRNPQITSTPPQVASIGHEYVSTVTAVDPDGDPLTYAWPTLPAGATVDAGGATARWTPSALGEYTFAVEARDDRGGWSRQTYTVFVNDPSNRAPRITSTPNPRAVVGQPYADVVAASDADGDPLAFELAVRPEGMTIDPGTGAVAWTPAASQVGDHLVRVQVRDGRGGVAWQTYAVRVSATGSGTANRPPVILSAAADSAKRDTPYRYDVAAGDPDGDLLTFGLIEAPAGMELDLLAGLLTWTPTQTGEFPVRVRVSDGLLWSEQSYTLRVVDGVPLSASLALQPALVDPDQPVSVRVVPANAASQVQVVLRLDGAAVPVDFQHRATVRSAQPGRHTLTATVTDGFETAEASGTFVVRDPNNPNAPPSVEVASAVTATLPGTTTLEARVSDDGRPGTGLTVAWTQRSGPATVTFTDATQARTEASFPAPGVYELRVTASDGELTTSADVLVTGRPGGSNVAPTFTSQPPPTARAGELFTYAVLVSDGNGDAVRFSLPTAPAGMAIDPTTGLVTWRPGPDDVGEVPVVVRVTDPAGLVTEQAFTLVVEPGSATPRITTTPLLVATAGGLYAYTALAVDADDSALTWSVSGPSDMQVDAGGRVTWSVPADAQGLYPVTLTVRDPAGHTDTQAYSIGVAIPGNTQAPVVTLLSPATGSALTTRRELTGTVTDQDLAGYVVRACRVRQPDSCRVLAQGTQPVTNGALATLDPMLLADGYYRVDVTARDAGGRVTTRGLEFTVATQGRKAPALRLRFPEFEVQTQTAALTVYRVYDGLDLTDGSLGRGWRYEWDTARISQPRDLNTGWVVEVDNSGFIPRQVVRPTDSHPVAVQLEDGRSYQFEVYMERAEGLSSIHPVDPVAVELSGTGSTLELLRGNMAPYTDYELVVYGNQVFESDFETLWRPRYARLKTQFDETIVFDATTGKLVAFSDGADFKLELVPSGLVMNETEVIRLENGTDGKVARATDMTTGLQATYRRDARGRLVEVTTAEGDVQTFTYDDEDQLTGYQAPGGGPERFEYDERGRVVLHTGPGGTLMRTRYDDGARTVTVVDAAGHAVVSTYDATGNVVAVTDPLGHTTRFEYQPGTSLETKRTDALGNVWQSAYDARGRPTVETNPLGETLSRTYDVRSGRILSVTDGEGRTFRETQDANGRINGYVLPDGRAARSFTYPDESTVVSRDGQGRETRTVYDARGRAVSETAPDGSVTRTVHDDDALTATVYLPNGQMTRTSFDRAGRAIQRDLPGGESIQYEFEGGAQFPAAVTRPDGVRVEFGENAAGEMAGTTVDGKPIQQVRYDALGRIASVQKNGQVTTFAYDAAGRVTEQATTDGAIRFTYDAAGRVTSETSSSGATFGYAYDAAGRPVVTENGAGQRFELAYDKSGRISRVTDKDGTALQVTYDANGRHNGFVYPGGLSVARTFALSDDLGEDPPVESYKDLDGVTWSYAHDTLGRLEEIMDGTGARTRYTRTAQGMVSKVEDALGRVSRFDWTASGLTGLESAEGRTQRFTHDTQGRLTSWTRADGTRVAYEQLGDRTVTRLPSGEVHEERTDPVLGMRVLSGAPGGDVTTWSDHAGRVSILSVGDGAKVEVRYTPEGQVASVSAATPAGTSFFTQYTYDGAGRVASVVGPDGGALSYGYDVRGRLVSVVRPNGTETTYGYGELSRPTLIEHRSGAGLLTRHEFAYDAQGRVIRAVSPQGTFEYGYDALSRLALVRRLVGGVTAEEITSVYDRVGNLVQRTDARGTTQYTYDRDDRLTSAQGPDGLTSYTYSDRGALLRVDAPAGQTHFTYDDLDRLTQVRLPDGQQVTYAYDAAGRLLSRTDAGGTRRCLPLPATPQGYEDCAVEYTPGAAERPEARVFGADGISSVHGPAGARFVLDGLQGNVVAVTDGLGARVGEATYSPFGSRTATGEGTAYGYTGERQDPATGLVYLRARWYHPDTGRFLTPDTYSAGSYDPRTLHRYAYAFSDPLNRTDPTGLFTLGSISVSFSISNVLRGVQAGFKLCLKQKITKKIYKGVALWAVNQLLSPVLDSLFAGLDKKFRSMVPTYGRERPYHEDLRDILCKAGAAGSLEWGGFQFEVQVDECGYVGGLRPGNNNKDREHLGAAWSDCAGDLITHDGLDIVYAGKLGIEVKLKGKTVDLEQVARYCRFGVRESSHVLVYAFMDMPGEDKLNDMATVCWSCFQDKSITGKPGGNQFLGKCSNSPMVGSILIAFGLGPGDGKKKTAVQVYVPDPNSLCGK